ncbi:MULTISPECIES: cupin domain-containing protein [unclassified Flavobacterium]|uniref:cupin domain-containing protein n=1 Tax=unclassified Flavobacterium TaxID=196869 RepID=UPI003F926AFB
MKYLVLFIISLSPLFSNAQQTVKNVKSYLEEGIKAPNNHHTGDAWLNFLVEADADFNQNITQANFSPNSILDWHKHSTAQIIIVVDGKGYYQEKGQKPIVIKKGDVIKCQKDTEHWHTSSKNSAVSYIAIYGPQPTIWTEKISPEYYAEIAKQLGDL